MGSNLSDGAKMGIVMVVCTAILSTVIYVVFVSQDFSHVMSAKFDLGKMSDGSEDIIAMGMYGKPLPMTNVVVAFENYGEPDRLCLQMEDLKGQGNPYPIADKNTDEMADLIASLKRYYEKKVYVYTFSSGGDNLQVCVSELPHESNADGNNWESRVP